MRRLFVLCILPLVPPAQVEEDILHLDQPPVEFLKRWSAAERARDGHGLLDLYLQVLERLDRRLCPVEPGRWVPCPRWLQRRLAMLPAAVLAPHESLAIERLRAPAGAAGRLRTAGRFLHTRAGQDALETLANEAFDEGRLEEAVRGWLRLLEVRPTPELTARAARAMALQGEIPLLDAPDPGAPIFAGGRQVEIGEFLHSLAPAAPPASPSAPADRGSPGEVLLGSYDLRLDGGAFARSLAVSIPAYATLEGREYAVFTNGVRVTALDPGRGDGGSLEDAVLWRYPPSEGLVRDLPTAYDSPRSPQPYLGVAVSGGRAFAVMFSRETRARLHARRPDRFDGPAAVRAFDLRTGRLLWDTDDLKVVDSEGEAVPALEALRFGHKNFCFSGPPVARGGRVLVAVMTTPNSERECHLLCLGAADGRVLWSTCVASAYRPGWATSVPSFIEEGGRIYVQSGFGVVAALETETGAVEWLVRYAQTGARSSVSLPVLAGSRAVFLVPDRFEPVVLDRRTGRDAPLPPLTSQVSWWRVLYLAGSWNGWFAATGSQSVAVNTADGTVAELGGIDAGRFWRGAAGRGRLHVPTARSLATFDTETWKLLDAPPWPPGGGAGNLVAADGICLSLSDRLSVTASAASLGERFRPRAEASPPRAAACLQAAAILEGSGRPLEAAAYYRRALSVLEGDPARAKAVEEIRKKLLPPPEQR